MGYPGVVVMVVMGGGGGNGYRVWLYWCREGLGRTRKNHREHCTVLYCSGPLGTLPLRWSFLAN